MDASTANRREATVNLGPAERVPVGEGKVYDAGGWQVAVFRTREGRIFATQSTCPHRRGPLADGLVGGTVVMCPLHAFKFDLSTGSPLGNDCSALVTYQVTVTAGGDMLLSVESG